MEAYDAVWQKRNAVNPNDGFFRVLQRCLAYTLNVAQI